MGICKDNMSTYPRWRGKVTFRKHLNHLNSNTNIFRASNTFCQLACGMFCSLGDFLRSGSDEIIKNMYDISDDIDDEDNNNR